MQQQQPPTPSTNPTRSLPLAGASNFRDLGGYQGLGGQTLRWRRLFRSDHLADLTPDDQARLQALGITRAIDFRGASERAARPMRCPAWPTTRSPLNPPSSTAHWPCNSKATP